MKHMVTALTALMTVLFVYSDATAQSCSPIKTCGNISSSWEATAECGDNNLRTNSRSFGNTILLNGEPVQALHQIHNLSVLYSFAFGLDDEGEDIASCFTESDEPFETVTAGGCEDAVAHRIVGEFCQFN